ncbi:neural proliferation differentiation and control protein 1 [Salmo salar]|uniref:Neural proliferation differentiation and control protein 1 n=1 Tax=Salmo salar TaxID=8030 RepID=A0A1S3PG89_SALSA|nr:neural proliferation differentiation and control protein 1-like [Salmo salar]|eukprot:XP_014026645.1 PREDICTED: neural proliferation differentiation and control protein 1-like [Salmo salar]
MPSQRRGVDHRPRTAATLLTQVAVFATFVAMSACIPGSSSVCPRSLDCARAGRHFCQPGSSHCGPCLNPLVENSHGRCIVKRRHAHAPHFAGKVTTFPEVDEEIDFLSTIISQQKESGVKHPAPLTQDFSKAEEEDDRSMILTQRPTTEQPTTHSTTTAPYNTTTAAPTMTAPTTTHIPAVRSGPLIIPYPSNDHVFIVMTSVFAVMGSVALLLAGVCWIRLQRGVRLAQKADYPAYGGMGPHSYDNNVPGDKRLAQSAQMYHYQHQKQQMLSLEKHRDEPNVPDSGATSDEENEDGDFTVYECPGLAPTGEMEVKNPLFDDSTLQRSHK